MAYIWKIVLLLGTLSSFCPSIISQMVEQRFSGYNDSECNYGGGFGERGRYDADLKYYSDNDNKAAAVSGLGNWIFYDNAGYSGESEAVVLREDSQCVPFRSLISRASSLKHVGDPSDYRLPSITIYKGTNYKGREVYVTGDHPKVLFDGNDYEGGWSDAFGSFVITGNSTSCWTLYYAINYNTGSSGITPICVCGQESNNFTPLFVPNNPFPPHHKIGSVKKGCVEATTNQQVESGFNSENKQV